MTDERGATAIEYSLITAVVCIPIVAALSAVGIQTSSLWSSVASNIVTAMGWK
jgi:Flp pilus assembly pilin Flp